MLILSVFCYIIRAINYVFVVLKVMLYMSDRLIDNKELMKEWNQEKNILYNPADLTSGSSKKVWWKCKNGHEWEAVIHTRVKGVGCPYCMSKKAIQGVNDFATLYPEMLKEWDYERGYLMDTCLSAQDKYKAYLDYFRIAYENNKSN